MDNLRSVVKWLARHEIWIMGILALPLLFPRGPWPWLSLGLIAGLWLARYASTGRISLTTGLELPIAVLLGMAIMGYSISLEPSISAPRFWSILLGMLVFYSFANWLSYSPARLIQATFGLGLLSLAIFSASLVGTDWHNAHMLAAPWLYDHLPNLLRNLPGSGLQSGNELFNPRWVGITMAILAPVFLALFLFGRRSRLKWFSGAVGLLSVSMVLLTQSVQGVLGLAAGFTFLATWRWRWARYLLAGGFVLAMVSLLIASFSLDLRSLAVKLLSIDNWAGIAIALRLDIWSRALAMINDMPYTGIGLNMFPTVLSHFYPGYLLGPEAHAHNLYLQTAADLGLPGLWALGWLMIAWGGRLRQNLTRRAQMDTPPGSPRCDQQILLAGVAASVIAYLAHGVMDALMLGAKPSVALWILLAMGVTPVLQQPNGSAAANPATSHRHRWRKWIPIGAFVGAGLASLLLWPAGWRMNLGAIQAHQALYQVETAGALDTSLMQRAQTNLQHTLEATSQRVFAYDLLGRMAAWQGNYPTAYGYFARRVNLDNTNAWWAYYPPRALIQRLENKPAGTAEQWQHLLEIYTQWATRYPQRAENYLTAGLVSQLYINEPAGAVQFYQNGITQNAQPAGLLPYALEKIAP